MYNHDFIFDRRGSEEGQTQINEEHDGPEETWMTWEPKNDLRLLRDDFQTTMLIGNDAVDSPSQPHHEMHYCLCDYRDNKQLYDPSADVYLMTNSQYMKV